MRKSKFKVMALMISLVMTVGIFAPLSVNCQNAGSDGFFRGGDETYLNRDGDIGISGGLSNDSFNIAPLGNGLLIMLVAGAGYTVRNRIKSRD